MGLPVRDSLRHTYADYASWPEDERWEIIDGIAYAMAPAPSRLHQEVVLELARQIANALLGKPCQVYIAPFDVRLPRPGESDDQIENVVQPDVSVICDPSKLDDRGCRGAPDWVIEVLSPQTAAHDQIVKRDLYERHGVQEFWLIHPGDQLAMVYLLEGGAYGKPLVRELGGELDSSAVPGVSVDLSRLVRTED